MNGPFKFEEKVFPEELCFIKGRRKKRGIDESAVPCAWPTPTSKTKPTSDLGLVGLALSGGGIRSAAFNLGVLQGMASVTKRRTGGAQPEKKERRLLSYFDYLSTVSGGGYIGSWLAAWIVRQGSAAKVEACLAGSEPRRSAQTWREPEPIAHLRRYSNYLTPQLGLFSLDTWAAFATYLRNLLLNQAIILPVVAALVVFPWLLLKVLAFPAYPGWILDMVTLGGSALAALGALVALVSTSAALAQLRRSREESGQTHRDRRYTVKQLHGLICFPLFVALLVITFLLVRHFLKVCESDGLLGLRLENPCFAAAATSLRWWPPVWWGLGGAGFAFISVLLCCRREGREGCSWKALGASLLLGALGGFVLYGAVAFGIRSVGRWTEPNHLPPHLLPYHLLIWLPAAGIVLFFLTLCLWIALRARCDSDLSREWLATMGGAFLIYAALWSGLFAVSLYGPLAWDLLSDWAYTQGSLVVGWIGSVLAAILLGKSPVTSGAPAHTWAQKAREMVTRLVPAIAMLGLFVAVATASHRTIDRLSGTVQKQTFSGISLTEGQVPGVKALVDVTIREENRARDTRTIVEDYWKRVRGGSGHVVLGFVLISSSIGLLMACFVDVNEFSMHAFYRNRLVRAYLRASRLPNPGDDRAPALKPSSPDPVTNLDPDDDFRLSKLAEADEGRPDPPQKPYAGPYPLINTALNLTKGSDAAARQGQEARLAWQERKACSFILSPAFCGSQETGYQPTAKFCGGMSLGTAFAISGAAFSPNWGYHSRRSVAFLLALFNVRLGWWVGNPSKDAWSRTGPRGGLFYLIQELLGYASDDSSYVYLSDGGHFDNLGLYELVRRRCMYIVCCDAGADPNSEFEDLGNAIRKIRTDFGVDVEIDLNMVKPRPGRRFSERHHAIGTIRYDMAEPGTPVGSLVYLKASLTEDDWSAKELADVLDYATQYPAFPHESIADQFFSESQFESYRRLGQHIARKVFSYAQASL